MKDMSLKESNRAINKVLDNAQELVEEATLLLNNKSFARAYSLAHLACEETEKIVMMSFAVSCSLLGKEFDWKRFYRRIRDHKEKIGGSLINEGYFTKNTSIDIGYYSKFLDNYKESSKENITKLNNLKNDSIYAGFKNNKFYKPSEVITEEMAVEQVEKANKLVDYHKRMIPNVQANMDMIQNDDFTKYKYQVFFEHFNKKLKAEK